MVADLSKYLPAAKSFNRYVQIQCLGIMTPGGIFERLEWNNFNCP
jgi:hypothetical protein